MAAKVKPAPIVTPENGADAELLEGAAALALMGELKRTIQRPHRQRLQDYIGQRIFVLGLSVSARGTQTVRVSINPDRSDPSLITVPPAVLQGLQRAFSARPNAVFAVSVVAAGKGKRQSATFA